ncbi:MAG: HD-GYP domain-containing protein [Deltaproteobacteria bacterium]|nr:HD-GYP domain-containing protein [Deltaproteobacteria bacterium]
MTLQRANDNPYKDDPPGTALLREIARLILISSLYEDNNKLSTTAVHEFKQAIQASSARSKNVTLQIVNGRFFIQEEKLPLFRKDVKLFNHMLQFFEKRSIYGFHFNANLETVTTNEILIFARFLNLSDKHDNPSEWLKTELKKNNINWLVVIQDPTSMLRDDSLEPELRRSKAQELDELLLKKEAAKKTYQYSLNSVKEVAEKLLAGKETSIRKSVRMVQRIIDIITEDNTTFFSLSTIRKYDDYTFSHSLNVALLAMSLGKQMGLRRKTLEKLGLCGLFHDLGKIEIPINILHKKEKLTEAEFDEIKKHPVNSALLILKLKTDKYHKVHLFVSPFEHHIRYDHSGYPLVGNKHPISLFGRILTIVDVYDAITSPRIYRPTPMSPDKALGFMLTNSGKHFDPLLLKIFVNMLGVYPIGTLLRMDTGEMGLVTHCSEKSDRTRPIVQLLIQNTQKQYTKGKLIDLADRNPKTGKFIRNIIKTQHPANYGIQAAKFLI